MHAVKPAKRHFKTRWYIIKQYVVIALVMTAIFLPVRLFFYNYVSSNWLGNLGVISAIVIIMFILIEKNKLGWFGKYFKNRIRRIVSHRTIWLIIISKVGIIAMYGFFLWEIDKIESNYFGDDLDFVLAMLIYDDPHDSFVQDIHRLGLMPSDEALYDYGVGLNHQNTTENRLDEIISVNNGAYFEDMILSVIIYSLNEDSGAWSSHFLTVIVVEELESLWLLAFYRKVYFKKVGLTWHKDLDLYPKNIKKMIK